MALCLVAAFWSCSRSNEEEFALHLGRGDRYAEQQKYAEAVIEYKNAVRAAPNDVATHWKLARSAIAIKDFTTAVAELDRITRLDPGHYDAQETLGRMYLVAGKTKEARRIAEGLVSAQNRRPEGYLLLARLAAREGNLATAISQFEETVQRDPTMDEAMVSLGHLYLLGRNSPQALAWYDRALKTRPDSIDAYMARGNYYAVTGQQTEADRDFDQAVSLSKGIDAAHLAIAIQHISQGRPFRAERELTTLVEKTKSRRARALLAELKLELG